MSTEPAILVAEDSKEDAQLIETALRRAGFSACVNFVPDGYEAVGYLEGCGPYADRSRFPFPSILISDLKMPRMNGLELVKWLRKHPRCHVLPVILLSGSGLSVDVDNAYKLGANTYFQKPPTFTELTDLMRKLRDYWMHSELPPRLDKC